MNEVSYQQYFQAFDRVKKLGLHSDEEIHEIFLELGFVIEQSDEILCSLIDKMNDIK